MGRTHDSRLSARIGSGTRYDVRVARALTICGLCDAGCGLRVELDGARVTAVRGDREDPTSRGHVCPKAVALADLQADPDRLRRPLRRRGADWEEIGWDEALDEIAARLADVQRRHGRDAAAFYFGNPVARAYATLLVLVPFARVLGTRNVFSANSLDAWPRTLVSWLLYGNQALLPVPDLERTRFLLVLGANPAVSNGSVMTAPGCRGRLAAIRARGGRVVVLDPRRSETAALADEHHFVRPGSDALLLGAMVHVLLAEGRVRLGALAGLVDGLDELRAVVREFPPERVAAAVGMSAAAIADLARRFAASDAAACYGRMGTCTQPFGTLATWLIDVLNLVTGNVDRAGGVMFPVAPVDLAGLAAALGQRGAFGRWRSRATGKPELGGELPATCLAAEIERAGAGQVRALVTLAANPALTVPNGRRVERALERLEFMASIDVYLNETSRHAHVVLPAPTPLEVDRFPLLEPAMAVRQFARLAPAILPRPPGAREDWETLVALAGRLGRRRGGAWRLAGLLGRAVAPRRVLDLLLRVGPHHLSLAALAAAPHGLDLGPLAPRLAAGLRRSRRRIDVVPALLRAPLAQLERALATGRDEGGLALVTRRELHSMNSWLHNLPRLARAGRCTLRMHPDDAARRGLTAGAMVRLAARVGAIEVPLEISDEMMPGVVSLPFGWGHDRPGTRLTVARAHAGASFNDVADDEVADAPSGTAVLDGIPVEVTRAAGGASARAAQRPSGAGEHQ
jgi:anaerobic selenocysteine-containing dehydrogenase